MVTRQVARRVARRTALDAGAAGHLAASRSSAGVVNLAAAVGSRSSVRVASLATTDSTSFDVDTVQSATARLDLGP